MKKHYVTLEFEAGRAVTQLVDSYGQGVGIVNNEIEYENTVRCTLWSLAHDIAVRNSYINYAEPVIEYSREGLYVDSHDCYRNWLKAQ